MSSYKYLLMMLKNSPLHYLSSSGSNNYFFPLTILWVGCAVPLLVLLELVREAAKVEFGLEIWDSGKLEHLQIGEGNRRSGSRAGRLPGL